MTNNAWLNREGHLGWTAGGGAVSAAGNAYSVTAPPVPEPGQVVGAFSVAANGWRTTDAESPLLGAGVGIGGLGSAAVQALLAADIRDARRAASAPTIGPHDYHLEVLAYDGQGRIHTRTVGDWVRTYTYDGEGRLLIYTDSADASRSAVYGYDSLGRRTGISVGGRNVRMVYDGADVLCDLIDENGDGTVDRRRYYALTGQIDQRLGFIDLVPGQAPRAYRYVQDHVGSIVAVLDESGAVVNRYAYDAFGNVRWEASFEQVENRHRFHGREYDAWAGHYYYRYRTYLPEYGLFTGPDLQIRIDAEGPGTYVFCNNNPMTWVDEWRRAPKKPSTWWSVKFGVTQGLKYAWAVASGAAEGYCDGHVNAWNGFRRTTAEMGYMTADAGIEAYGTVAELITGSRVETLTHFSSLGEQLDAHQPIDCAEFYKDAGLSVIRGQSKRLELRLMGGILCV